MVPSSREKLQHRKPHTQLKPEKFPNALIREANKKNQVRYDIIYVLCKHRN